MNFRYRKIRFVDKLLIVLIDTLFIIKDIIKKPMNYTHYLKANKFDIIHFI